MANVCEYKIIVKGKKNACYAFMGSTSNYGGKEEDSWTGSDEYGELRFHGDCKWSIDSYCTPFEGTKPVELPSDYKEAEEEGENRYLYTTVRERSEMFQVEVFCNSADVEEGVAEIFEHYVNGEPTAAECPPELKVLSKETRDYNMVNNLLEAGLEIGEIAGITGLSPDEIEQMMNFDDEEFFDDEDFYDE